MTRAEALELLDLPEGADNEEIVSRYREFFNDYQMRLTNAPTAQLKNLYTQNIEKLELALQLLCPETEADMTKYLPTDKPMFHAEHVNITKTNTGYTEAATPKIEKEQGKTKTGGASKIMLLIAALLFIGALIVFFMIYKQTQTYPPVVIQDSTQLPTEDTDRTTTPTTTKTPPTTPPTPPINETQVIHPPQPSAQITLASLSTDNITRITESTATAGGNVTSDGGSRITERGIVYSTSNNPTTSNSKVSSGSGTGSFTANITGLRDNTTYYVRAYAINEAGTAYGEIKPFTTDKLKPPLSPIVQQIESEMVYIPAGSFYMGSPDTETDRDSDEHRHYVTMSAFYMSKYEVTYEQYDAFCDATGRSKPSDNGWGRGRRPVTNVSWHDATAFCEWISKETGKKYQLPSEAQWEYAARAGTTTPFHTGNCLSTSQSNYDGNFPYSNCSKGEYRKKTMPVESFAPNAYGLYNMHGNVWEWCLDWYNAEYYSNSPQNNPVNNTPASYRVLRGGSWNSIASYCRSADRSGNTPDDRNRRIGFRLSRM
jgi:sulfatase modifying factor 1